MSKSSAHSVLCSAHFRQSDFHISQQRPSIPIRVPTIPMRVPTIPIRVPTISLLCGPISPVVNLEMLSNARFFLWKCNIWVLRTRKLPDAKFFIHSILRN